jgi:hypothetical protein
MKTDESQRVLPFQLQFDKPVASQVFNVAVHVCGMYIYVCVHFLIRGFTMADKNFGMEPREGFASHGYGRLQDFATSFQLAEVVDNFSW